MIEVDVQLERSDFSLDVAFRSETRVTGVFGPSGAGKTTLIHLMAGLERPDRGSIVLDGRTLFDSTRGIDVPAHRRCIGVVFQEPRLFPHYSVSGNLLYGSRRDRGRLESITELLELQPLLKRPVEQLSGGERQRIGLGRALLSDPQVLLLDEPLVSLDQRLRQQILPYLRRVRDVFSVPTLYVSHELLEILQLTDELLVIEAGRAAGHGRYADLVHEDAVLSVVHDRGMTNLLHARVTAHQPEDGVTVLAVGRFSEPPPAAESAAPPSSTQLIAPITSQAPGKNVTVSLRPWDIALAAQPVEGVSIQNQIRGTVTRCTLHDRRALVEIDIGTPIIAEISRRSAARMKIDAGAPITCLIKSHAIRYLEATEVFETRRATEGHGASTEGGMG